MSSRVQIFVENTPRSGLSDSPQFLGYGSIWKAVQAKIQKITEKWPLKQGIDVFSTDCNSPTQLLPILGSGFYFLFWTLNKW